MVLTFQNPFRIVCDPLLPKSRAPWYRPRAENHQGLQQTFWAFPLDLVICDKSAAIVLAKCVLWVSRERARRGGEKRTNVRPCLQLQLPLGGSLSRDGAGIPPDERTGDCCVYHKSSSTGIASFNSTSLSVTLWGGKSETRQQTDTAR